MTVKVCEPEVPPPGAGFVTVTGTVVPEAMFAAVTVAVRLIDELYVVTRGTPFQFATDVGTKFVPVSASEN